MMTTVLSTPEVVIVESLTERCDGCGAAAKLEVHLTNGGSLAFCGHHANRHAGELAKVASRITAEDGFEWTAKVPSP
jgi:hypothetical protein